MSVEEEKDELQKTIDDVLAEWDKDDDKRTVKVEIMVEEEFNQSLADLRLLYEGMPDHILLYCCLKRGLSDLAETAMLMQMKATVHDIVSRMDTEVGEKLGIK